MNECLLIALLFVLSDFIHKQLLDWVGGFLQTRGQHANVAAVDGTPHGGPHVTQDLVGQHLK